MKTRRDSHRRAGLLLASGIALLFLSACDGDSGSPTAPSTRVMLLDSVAISVDGTVYNGRTYHRGRGSASSTRFEARLHWLDGEPVVGEQVRVRLRHGAGMMSPGDFVLYDDGTHGDPFPRDGFYCFDDFTGTYGFHHRGAGLGEFHYELWGWHHDGNESNHVEVRVEVADS